MFSKFKKKRDFLPLVFIGAISLGPAIGVCDDLTPSKGVGPIKSVTLDSIKNDLAIEGKIVFTQKCSGCHKMDERYAGPALKGVSQRRHPEWIMNMILNPMEMTQKDDTAKALLEEYLAQMTFQDVSETQARSILEYFRYYDTNGELKSATSEPTNKKKEKNKK